MIQKLFLLTAKVAVLILFFLFILFCFAYTNNGKSIPFSFENKTSISIFDVYSNEIIYFYKERELLMPASTMKLVTSIDALSILGPYYIFDVKLFKINDGGILISSNYNPSLIEEIIPDPYNFFKQSLRDVLLANKIEKINKVYIDSSLPSVYPESWKIYEGEPFAPYLSTFSFNQNMIKIQKKQNHFIIYPPVFDEIKDYKKISNLVSNLKEIDGAYWYIYPSSDEFNKKILKKMFEEIGYDVKVELLQKWDFDNVEYLASFPTATLLECLKYQNHWSDNFVSQQIYNKLKYELKIDPNSIYSEFGVFVDDGCGLSRKNRISSYFLAYLLAHLDDYGIINYLCYTLPGYNEGTLERRDLPPTVKAKTGTLNDVSSLAGYVKSKSGKWYSFAIIYNGPNVYNAKLTEEKILNYIYENW